MKITKETLLTLNFKEIDESTFTYRDDDIYIDIVYNTANQWIIYYHNTAPKVITTIQDIFGVIYLYGVKKGEAKKIYEIKSVLNISPVS